MTPLTCKQATMPAEKDWPEDACIDEMEHVLNLIRHHCKENNISAKQAARIFEEGMFDHGCVNIMVDDTWTDTVDRTEVE